MTSIEPIQNISKTSNEIPYVILDDVRVPVMSNITGEVLPPPPMPRISVHRSPRQQRKISRKTGEVQLKRVLTTRRSIIASYVMSFMSVASTSALIWWLFYVPAHIPDPTGDSQYDLFNYIARITTGIMMCLLWINCVSLSLATLAARIPVPWEPLPGLRVALFITFVPSTEDLDGLERTLRASKNIVHDGVFNIFVLDEQNDPSRAGEVSLLISRLNSENTHGNKIYYITRRGIPEYNQKSGPFTARTKYGNINAALDKLDKLNDPYDITMGIDPDHQPVADFARRMLGYFRAPDVGYVVGPQVYANAVFNRIARWCESQQFPFHSIIQLAANRRGAAMLVGTSYAIRTSLLRSIGGLTPSVTEDLATTFNLMNVICPETKTPYRGVYTPDVLAHGEGPSNWGDFRSQQERWARGTFELLIGRWSLIGSFWMQAVKLSRQPQRLFHYILIMSFYPSMAIGWILGAFNSLLYGAFGSSGVIVEPMWWIFIYIWTIFFQFNIYRRFRAYNVSPYEDKQSWGITGMLMSVLASPIYANALLKTLLRLPNKFVVTKKGTKATGDTWLTFRINFVWAAIYGCAVVLMSLNGYASFLAMTWPMMGVVISLTPVAIWRWDIVRAYLREGLSRQLQNS